MGCDNNASRTIWLDQETGAAVGVGKNSLVISGASTIHHIGAIDQGIAMKLAVNALFGIHVAALAEIIGMVSKNGVTSATALECLR